MSYSHAVPHSRSGGGFSPFLLLLVLLAIVGSILLVMTSQAERSKRFYPLEFIRWYSHYRMELSKVSIHELTRL